MAHEIPIAYGIFILLIFLGASYFVLAYFNKWPPYRKTNDSGNTINTKNKSFNNSIFYISLTILIISFILLLVIIIVSTTIKHKQKLVLKKIITPVVNNSNNNSNNNLSDATPTKRIDDELTQREILLQKELQENIMENKILKEKLIQEQMEGIKVKNETI